MFFRMAFKTCLLVADFVLKRIQVHLIVAYSSNLVYTYSRSFVFVSFYLFANKLKISFFTRLILHVKGPCACDIATIILGG